MGQCSNFCCQSFSEKFFLFDWTLQNISGMKISKFTAQVNNSPLAILRLWPFWDGENVTLSKVAGDLQRLGRTMVRVWITWPEFPWYLFVKGSKYQRRHDVGSQNSRFEARRFQVPKSGNWGWKMMVLLGKSVKNRHLPPKHDPHLSCREFLLI